MSRIKLQTESSSWKLGTSARAGGRIKIDRDAELSRRFDLGIGRITAAVLGDEDIDPFPCHQRDLIVEREGAARQHEAIVRQFGRRLRRIDAADEIMMDGGRLESRKLQTPDGEKHAARNLAERARRCRGIIDLAPAIAVTRHPRRSREESKRHAGFRASDFRMRRHLLGKRMRRIDDESDRFGLQIRGQPGNAAEAADAKGDRRQHWILGSPGERESWRDARVARKPLGKQPGLRRAAEDQYAQRTSHLYLMRHAS